MRSNFSDFTRGSQLLGHFGFMFAAGLKGPLLVTLALLFGLLWWRIAATLSDNALYLCGMRLYGWSYRWLELDPGKLVSLELASGRHLLLAAGSLPDHPLVVAAWRQLEGAIGDAASLATLVSLPATAVFARFAAWFGHRSKLSRHERGATLTDLRLLVAEIEAHNGEQRARAYRAALGPAWRLASPAELRKAGLYRPFELAGVPFPWRREQSHAMLIGTTGTGKTVVLRDLLSQVRDSGARAVVFDLTGAFIEAFYDPERDTILNPLDARCPQWSMFDDCPDEASLTAAAEALVPHDGGGAEQFWVLAARMLFVEMCLKLKREGRASNAALSDELMTASLSHVHQLMKGTMADPLTAPEAARMAESIRAVFNANAKAIRMLPRAGKPFSVRRWVQGERAPGAMLFVSARYVDMPVASRLLTVWMDMAMATLMAGPRTSECKLWFLFDELGALHRLPAIEKGLQTARNYGGAIVLGVHAYAKLKETYGDNMAMTLASLARTKLILATADRESATWCSDFIGHRQYQKMEEGFSYGYNNARDAVSLTPRRQIEPLLLPDQLMNLPSLQGYLKFPDGFPAAAVSLRYRHWPVVAEPFVPRPSDDLAPTGAARPAGPAEPPGDTPTGANDQGPGPAAARRTPVDPGPLGVLPLFGARGQSAAAPIASDPTRSRPGDGPRSAAVGSDTRAKDTSGAPAHARASAPKSGFGPDPKPGLPSDRQVANNAAQGSPRIERSLPGEEPDGSDHEALRRGGGEEPPVLRDEPDLEL